MSSKSEQSRREHIRVKNAEYQNRKEKRLSEQDYAKREQERLHKAELKQLEEAGEWICKPKKTSSPNSPTPNAKPVPTTPTPVTKLDLSIIDSVEDTEIKWTKQKINWAESDTDDD